MEEQGMVALEGTHLVVVVSSLLVVVLESSLLRWAVEAKAVQASFSEVVEAFLLVKVVDLPA